jgi:lipopolysaccharide biosynthesis protein
LRGVGSLPWRPSDRWACVVHLFYGNLWPEIAPIATHFLPHLYVFVPEGAVQVPGDLPGHVLHTPNRGMDIGTFVLALRDFLLDGPYDMVVKIHSKRIDAWRRHAIDGAIRGCPLLETNPSLGMVGSSHYLCTEEFTNTAIIDQFHHMLFGRRHGDRRYFAGTIFAARLEPFRRVLSKDLLTFLYDQMLSGHYQDLDTGSVAHSVERLLGHIVTANGYDLVGV